MNFLSLILIFFQLIIAVFIITFHTSGYRLGYNPIVAKVRAMTEPVVMPFRKIIPATRFEFAQLVPAIIIALVIGFILSHSFIGALAVGIGHILLQVWLNVIFYTLLITVIASWLQTDPRQPVMQICLSCTEWLLEPIRRVLPAIAGLDFSPLVALFLIQMTQSLISKAIASIMFS